MIRIWTLFILILFNIQLCCNYVLYTNIRQSLNLLEVNFWFVFWFFLQIIEMTESSLSVEDAQEESLQCATSQMTAKTQFSNLQETCNTSPTMADRAFD